MSEKNEREDHRLAGEVSVEEAREALGRFVRSHFRHHDYEGKERARFSIPADPRRDDDIRLGAFISRAEVAFRRIEAALDVLGDAGCSCECDHVAAYDDHEEGCERCLACRIEHALRGDAA